MGPVCSYLHCGEHQPYFCFSGQLCSYQLQLPADTTRVPLSPGSTLLQCLHRPAVLPFLGFSTCRACQGRWTLLVLWGCGFSHAVPESLRLVFPAWGSSIGYAYHSTLQHALSPNPHHIHTSSRCPCPHGDAVPLAVTKHPRGARCLLLPSEARDAWSGARWQQN